MITPEWSAWRMLAIAALDYLSCLDAGHNEAKALEILRTRAAAIPKPEKARPTPDPHFLCKPCK